MSEGGLAVFELHPIVAPPARPSDHNFNRAVDAANYNVWRDSLGQTAAGLANDGNSNIHIAVGDYTVCRTYFGETASGGGAAAVAGVLSSVSGNVPEPTTLVLLILATIGVCLRGNKYHDESQHLVSA